MNVPGRRARRLPFGGGEHARTRASEKSSGGALPRGGCRRGKEWRDMAAPGRGHPACPFSLEVVMPCRKLFSLCHCGGELWIVVEIRVGVIVCPDCVHRKLAGDESSHPLLAPRNLKPLSQTLPGDEPEPFNQN